jgi:hypothetical protein
MLHTSVSAEHRAEWTQQCVEAGYEVIEFHRDSPPTEPFIFVAESVIDYNYALCDWKKTSPARDPIVHFVSHAVFTSTAADPLGAFPASIDAFRRVFQGLTFHFCTQDSSWDHALSSAMDSLGGRVETELTDSVTHVVVESASTKMYRAAFRQKKTITDWKWIRDCFDAGLMAVPREVKLLRGARISCVSLPAEEVAEIKRLVEANGGQYIDDAHFWRVTRIISGYPVPPNLSGDGQVVSRLWLEEMIDPDTPMVDPEAEYPPRPREEEDAIRASWRREKEARRQLDAERSAAGASAAAAADSSHSELAHFRSQAAQLATEKAILQAENDLWKAMASGDIDRVRVAAGKETQLLQQRLVAVKEEKMDVTENFLAARAEVRREQSAKRKITEESEERKAHDERRIAEHQQAAERLAEEKRRLSQQVEDQKLTCIICGDAPPNLRYDPCGHVLMCAGCDAQLHDRRCPTCRQPIARSQKVYM